MFCHVCGAKLIENACFCSKCGTPVPSEVWEEPVKAPAAPQAPVIAPSPVVPVPMPETEPKPEPVPEPKPVSAPEREPEAVPAPKPEPVPETAPAPKPEPAPETAPAPKPEPVPETAPVPEPEPKPDPVPELPEEKVIVSLCVTREQIQRRETVVLQDDALQTPMQLTLRQGMGNGMRLRLTNAELKPSPTGAKRLLVVVLKVKEPIPKAVEKSDAKPSPRTTPEPKRKTVSFAPIMTKCGFQLCPERELKTGYHFGGNEDEGHLYISAEQLTLYKKSKAVGIAFGAIGSAIEGKGKQLAVIVPGDIASHEKASKNDYRIHLKDGRILKVSFFPRDLEASLSALDQFLSQI